MSLRTSSGEVKIALTGRTAPCTVRNFVHLAGKRFYDDTRCHRLTASPLLKVLQCGDPLGTGMGGPGYTIPDEISPNYSGYERGMVCMATRQVPNSGGSQFFIFYGNSTVRLEYTVFGTADQAGLAVIDKIAATGVNPTNSPEDGEPKTPVTIQQAVVGA